MSQYTNSILALEHEYNTAQELKRRIDALAKELEENTIKYSHMEEAQQILVSISKDTTQAVLDYITVTVNKTLESIFPHDPRRIAIEKQVKQGVHSHMNIVLYASNGAKRDLALQTGKGLEQVISFLFVLCLITVRQGRPLLVFDEVLSGLHLEAKKFVMEIIEMFAKKGFQFVFVEHHGATNNGKVYLVENPDGVATITPVEGEYNDEPFMFNRPPEDLDITKYSLDSEDDEL